MTSMPLHIRTLTRTVFRTVAPLSALALSAFALTACQDDTGPSSDASVGVGFQLARASTATALVSTADAAATGSAAAMPGSVPTITTSAAGMRIARDSDVLLVTKAQLVVRNVKLKTATAVCSDDDDDESSGSSSASSTRREDASGCAAIRVGPYLVDVPVTGADGARVAVAVPAGTYASIRLWLYRTTSNDSADVAFRQANPTFKDISLRLEGTFNGTPFVFVNDVNAKLTVPLSTPLVVGTGGGDVTVTIDLSTWFLRPSGGLYSPADASTPGQIRAQVQNNVRGAFRAFRDGNRDGRED